MTEPYIVSVEPISRVFSITWNLGIRCNYDCMYCPTKWHNDTSKHHSLETLQNAWLSIYNKTAEKNLKYKISFTGGEVTSSRAFLPFVRWLKINYSDKIDAILTTTNGSATTKYYLKLYEYVDNISFSVHSEHIDENKFFNTILEIASTVGKSKFIHVNIMDEFWNQDRIPYYVNLLQTHGVSHNINKIDYSLKTREYPTHKGNLNFDIPGP